MKNIKIISLGIVAIALIALAILLIEPGTKELTTGTNQSPNVEDKETNMNITNKQNLNYTEKHPNTSLSANSFENNSNVKVYVYKTLDVYKTLEDYTTTVYVANLSTSDGKKYVVDTIDNRSKENIELKIENNNIYMKVTPLTGGGFERDYKTVDWNDDENINVEDIKNMGDLIFSFDILYFQDLKNIEKYNITGIKNVKIIKTECSNESEEVYISNPGAGSRNITVYNCTSFYEINYVRKVNNKTINKSWIENSSCQLSKPESGCGDGLGARAPYFEKIYFAGTENFNGKIAYKIIYEKFKNVSEISVWHFVDTYLIDEKGILLKATAKDRWITNDVPEDEFVTTKEIVLEKEY